MIVHISVLTFLIGIFTTGIFGFLWLTTSDVFDKSEYKFMTILSFGFTLFFGGCQICTLGNSGCLDLGKLIQVK